MTQKIPPGLAWLLVFLPTLFYVAITRLCASHEYGSFVSDGLYRVAEGFDGIVDMTWRHDAELGRGYLLLSESSGNGRVWRWELGGGPISIGTTLHLDQSGCRSARCTAQAGSGALGIQFSRDGDTAREGSLLVSEIGEGRIVRLEENGARTPLLLWRNVLRETSCGNPALEYPHRMVVTATGDLITVGEISIEPSIDETGEPSCVALPALFKVSSLPHVPGLPTLELSRQAHTWDALNHTASHFWSDPSVSFIGGVAVTEASLFVSAIQNGIPVILTIELDEISDGGVSGKRMHNLSDHGQVPGGVVIAETALFATVDSNLVRIENSATTVIPLPELPTSLLLGDDKYLYISSRTNLYRTMAKTKPYKMPTHLMPRVAAVQ